MRTEFRVAAIFSVLLSCQLFAAAVQAEDSERPNILFIFADDQSFETIHAHGLDEIQTPNLDSLSQKGVSFTHAYNMGAWNGAVCVASRAMLNTGRFLWHAHANVQHADQDVAAGRYWSQYMGEAGYETYFTLRPIDLKCTTWPLTKHTLGLLRNSSPNSNRYSKKRAIRWICRNHLGVTLPIGAIEIYRGCCGGC